MSQFPTTVFILLAKQPCVVYVGQLHLKLFYNIVNRVRRY